MTAVPSAKARRQEPPPQTGQEPFAPIGERQEQDPEDGGEAQLPADVAADARVDRQGHDRRQGQRVQAGRPAALKGRHQAYGAHHSRALDRGAGAGQRDVDGDQADRPEQALAQRDPEQRQDRHRQKGEQGHVLAADRREVAQTGADEVFLRALVEFVVVAEDETTRQCRLARRHALPQPGLGPFSDLPRPRHRERHHQADPDQDRQRDPRRAHRSGLEAFAQRFHRRGADPRDLIELVDRRQAAVFFAELDDVFRRHWTDAVDRVEFGRGRGREADRAVFFDSGPRRGRGARRRAGNPFRDDYLLAVGEPGGEVQRVELRLPRRPSRPLDRFLDPAAFRKPVDARLRDRPGDVDHDIAPGSLDGEVRFRFRFGFAGARVVGVRRGPTILTAHGARTDEK